MRSLALRWVVSVVVGCLWGAVIVPARSARAPSPEASNPAAVDATHYPAIEKAIALTELRTASFR